MTLRTIIITAAIASVAVLEMSGSASAAGGSKETWVRTKPHVNVGTIGQVNRKKTSGQTTVIGGIQQNWHQTLPSAQRKELLIFVTPHIVQPTN